MSEVVRGLKRFEQVSEVRGLKSFVEVCRGTSRTKKLKCYEAIRGYSEEDVFIGFKRRKESGHGEFHFQ